MQEAADGSRTTGRVKEGLAAWGDRPISGERLRERDREAQGGGKRGGRGKQGQKEEGNRDREKGRPSQKEEREAV